MLQTKAAAALSTYWIYYLDSVDNLLDAEPLLASSDLDAMVRAMPKADGNIIELWTDNRLLVRVERQSIKRRS